MTNSRLRVIIVLLSVLIKSLLSNPAGSSLEHEAGKCYGGGGGGGDGGGGGGGGLYIVEVDPCVVFSLRCGCSAYRMLRLALLL